MSKNTQFVLAAAFIRLNGKVLIVQRAADDDYLAGYWEVVGGRTDFGENPYDTVVREVKEEAGLTIKPIKPYSVFTCFMPDGRQAIDIAFHCELIGEPTVTLSHEHQNFKWVGKDEVETISPISDEMRETIRRGFL